MFEGFIVGFVIGLAGVTAGLWLARRMVDLVGMNTPPLPNVEPPEDERDAA